MTRSNTAEPCVVRTHSATQGKTERERERERAHKALPSPTTSRSIYLFFSLSQSLSIESLFRSSLAPCPGSHLPRLWEDRRGRRVPQHLRRGEGGFQQLYPHQDPYLHRQHPRGTRRRRQRIVHPRHHSNNNSLPPPPPRCPCGRRRMQRRILR